MLNELWVENGLVEFLLEESFSAEFEAFEMFDESLEEDASIGVIYELKCISENISRQISAMYFESHSIANFGWPFALLLITPLASKYPPKKFMVIRWPS